MRISNWAFFLFILYVTHSATCDEDLKKPTVLIAILIRNKAHTLPYFLSFLERQDYPKQRISLWIRSDNNVDTSIEVLKEWLETKGEKYHSVDLLLDKESKGFSDERDIADWSPLRFTHIINLREEALNYGRSIWADFLWMLDADAFLTNPKTLDNLLKKPYTVMAPMLKSDGMYSNFWAGMTSDYYYLRTDRYEPILYAEETGCFNVPMVHSAVLINLRKIESDRLTYNAENLHKYDGPEDDIITFALGANATDIPLYICNEETYGFVMVPLESGEGLRDDLERLTNIKVEILAHDNHLPVSRGLEQFVTYPKMSTLGVDKIYMINLLRRPERRSRMHRLFREIGIQAETIDAVDGKTLNESSLKEWGVKTMPEYADPYHRRPMTTGEIGCFLSHYVVWNKVLKEDLDRVIVLEDDVRFEPFFRQKVEFVLEELKLLNIKWDLVYLGRKRLMEKGEAWVPGSKYMVQAAYSYWTLGYLLSKSGAKKLVDASPLEKLVPVDEYLPILSDAHPKMEWKIHYPNRDLVVLSTNPLLIHPTHYTGEQGYISDTENSTIVKNDSMIGSKMSRVEL